MTMILSEMSLGLHSSWQAQVQAETRNWFGISLLWATGRGQVLERHYQASSSRTELGEDRSRQGVWMVEDGGKASTLGAVMTYVGC